MSTSIEDLRSQLATTERAAPAQAVSLSQGVESDRAIAMIQGQMTLARKFPRKQGEALTRIIESCQLLPVAEDAHYSFKRGGSVIEGPSIDLLKLIACNWGNIIWEVAEVERRPGESTAIAFAIDLETNAMQRLQFVVRHIRDKNDESGDMTNVALKSDRDIRELINNYGSRSVRSCLEGIIPPHIIGAARQRCYLTLKEAAEKTPLAQRLQELVPGFATVDVTQAMLVKYLGGRAISEMLEKEYIQLRNIYRSIISGAQRVEDFFEKATVADSVAAGKQNAKRQDEGKSAEKKQPAVDAGKTDQPAAAKDEGAKPLTKADLMKLIDACTNVAAVNAMSPVIKAQKHLPTAELAEVRAHAGAKVKALNAPKAEQQVEQREPGSDDDTPE